MGTMELRDKVAQAIIGFVRRDPANTMPAHGGLRIYDEPLVGFASAADSLFETYKEPEVIGPHHLTPAEWLSGARTVVSYFLPFTEEVRASNREEGLPSEYWVSARIDGEAFNNALRKHLVETLKALGGDALAPGIDSRFAVRQRRSNWSERHAAFAAGLGSFGLSKSLITVEGCSGRYGSVITTLALEPTPRTASTPFDACPFLTDGSCGLCIARCPSGAITEKGKDTAVCSAYLDNVVKPKYAPRYGCAKCQNGVPCEFETP